MQYLFTINQRLPGLNEYTRACRSHWSKGAKLKADIEDLIGWEIMACKAKKITAPIVVCFEWVEANDRRDIDNICFAKKFILDAMQSTGLIKGDDAAWVKGFRDTFTIDKSCKAGKVIVHCISYEEDES